MGSDGFTKKIRRLILPEEFLATVIPLDAVDWLEAGEDTAQQHLSPLQPILGHHQPRDLHRQVVLTDGGGERESEENQGEHGVRGDR